MQESDRAITRRHKPRSTSCLFSTHKPGRKSQDSKEATPSSLVEAEKRPKRSPKPASIGRSSPASHRASQPLPMPAYLSPIATTPPASHLSLGITGQEQRD